MYTIEEFDQYKSKVLKYVLYKKRTKQEIKNKFFGAIDEDILNDIINELEENGYIDDSVYIEKAIKEFMNLNNLSVKEVRYKLLSKGISSSLVDDYMQSHLLELTEYELESARKIAIKKQNIMDEEELQEFLFKKGYVEESVKQAVKEIES